MNAKHLIQAAADLDEESLGNLKKLASRAGNQIAEMFPFQRRPSLGVRALQGGGFVLLGVAIGVAGVAITYVVNPKLLASVGKLIRTTVHDAEGAVSRAVEGVVGKGRIADKGAHLSSAKDEGSRHRGSGNGHKSHGPS
jgi:hypothetical protein